MAVAPRVSLPRSPAGILAGPQGVALPESSSSSSSSTNLQAMPSPDQMPKPISISPLPPPPSFDRRPSGLSTSSHSSSLHLSSSSNLTPGHSDSGTPSGQAGLDYYWSNLAGHGSNSSLDMSPSPSVHSVGLGLGVGKGKSRSSLSLAEAAKMQRQASASSSTDLGGTGLEAPSSRRVGRLRSSLDEGISPGGWSAASRYSSSHESFGSGSGSDSEAPGEPTRWDRQSSGASEGDYCVFFGGSQGDHTAKGLLDSSARDSALSGMTYRPGDHTTRYDGEVDGEHKTPMPPQHADHMHDNTASTAHFPPFTPKLDATPRISQTTPKRGTPPHSASSASSRYTPTSGRPPFFASPAHSVEDEVRRGSVVEEPRSAPAWQGEFGGGTKSSEEEQDEETLKGRRGGKRSTLPPVSGRGMEGEKGRAMLSPDKQEDRRGRAVEPSPGRSPQVPARSSLRTQRVPIAKPAPATSTSTSPRSASPHAGPSSVPTITKTGSSPGSMSGPLASRAASRPQSSDRTGAPTRGSTHHFPDQSPPLQAYTRGEPLRPARSPERMSPRLSASSTINDLTDMLGGAIDEIGLIDSRETPPPDVVAPLKTDRKKQSLAPAAELIPLTLQPSASSSTSPTMQSPLALRAASRSQSSLGAPDGAGAPTRGVRKTQSVLSLRAGSSTSVNTTTMNIAARPWPAAMLYGQIKTLKNAGDRAKAYARGINDLSRAETGLREWCTASAAQQTSRPLVRASTKMSGHSSLGIGSSRSASSHRPQLSAQDLTPLHPRQVSSSSEFPLRSNAESYSAREISQRVIDPHDQPTALPANLPYPQLQQAVVGSGMRPSQSMQSVASFATTLNGDGKSKRGFFGIGGRKGKKDSYSLGAPHGGPAVAMGKKDVRGLPISSPTYPAPERRGSDSSSTHRVGGGSISAPMGPRGPRVESYTPPPVDRLSMDAAGGHRASLDTGLSRLGGAGYSSRASVDDGGAMMRHGKSSLPADEDQVRRVADVLPHVEKGVLRVYLKRYGEEMTAIGAYLEDEKSGNVLRS